MADELIVDIEKRFASGTVVAAALRSSTRGGRTLVLFGPSGAGKTTVVRCIAGLERPDSGHIRFGGDTWFDAAGHRFVEPQARGVGYVGQHSALFPHLTVRQNVGYALGAGTAAGRTARIDEMLALLDLGDLERRHPRELSGGEAQRVALARAVAPAPRLLLLDEPLGALDVPTRQYLRRQLRSLIERTGVFAVLVTHDRTEAIALGDEMAVLAEGRIRQVGPTLEVFGHPADLVVARTVGVESVVPAQITARRYGLVDLCVGSARLLALDADLEPSRTDVFACVRAEDVTLQRDGTSGGSARNHLPGRVTSIEREGPVERVTVDCGFPLVALITAQAREEMSLAVGASVTAVIKATSIHLV